MDELNSTKLTQIKVMDPDRLTDGDEISAAQAAGIHFEAQLQTSRINTIPFHIHTVHGDL